MSQSAAEAIPIPTVLNLDIEEGVHMFDYQVPTDNSKNTVVLECNVVSFLRKGKKELLFDEHAVGVTPPNFVIMRSGHCLMSERIANDAGKFHSTLLFFSNEMLDSFMDKHDFQVSQQLPRKPFQVCEYDEYLSAFRESLDGIAHLPKRVRQSMLKLKLEELLLYLVETMGEEFINFLRPGYEQKSDLVRIVESNKLNKLSLKELAFLCNMSVSTFKREFEKCFNTSPSKWFQDNRLEYAAYLLRTKGMRPSEVYMEAGYESLSNFIQAFKAKYEKTPKQYQLQG